MRIIYSKLRGKYIFLTLVLMFTATLLVSCGQMVWKAEEKLPEWFELREKDLDKEKAEKLIEAYKISEEKKEKYAEAHVLLGQYKEAEEIYGALAIKRVLQGSDLLEASDFGIMGIPLICLGMEYNAKRIYCDLKFKGKDIKIKELYKIHETINFTLNLVRIDAFNCFRYEDISIPLRDSELLKTCEESIKKPKEYLLSLEADVEAKMKKLGYSPEDF